jgi:hypothetical protein
VVPGGELDLEYEALRRVDSPPVLSKARNYRLWRSGAYGNKLRSWRTVDEWRASGFSGLVALRTLLGDGGHCCQYDRTPGDVPVVLESWASLGVPLDRVTVDEAAPAGDVVLQGEYLDDVYVAGGEVVCGHLYYSRTRRQMRDALVSFPEEARGLRADLLLSSVMTPSSLEDWKLLTARYPGHVLVVSVYGRCLGDVPGRNALVWEVRRY